MLNKKGFTLIEILLVLSIITMISSISFTYHSPIIKDQDIIKEISDFFYKAHMNSIINKEKTNVFVHNNYLEYSSSKEHESIVLPDIIKCNSKTFSYNINGNIYKASTLEFIINGSQYFFVFQVGSGSFEVR